MLLIGGDLYKGAMSKQPLDDVEIQLKELRGEREQIAGLTITEKHLPTILKRHENTTGH